MILLSETSVCICTSLLCFVQHDWSSKLSAPLLNERQVYCGFLISFNLNNRSRINSHWYFSNSVYQWNRFLHFIYVQPVRCNIGAHQNTCKNNVYKFKMSMKVVFWMCSLSLWIYAFIKNMKLFLCPLKKRNYFFLNTILSDIRRRLYMHRNAEPCL